MRQNHLLAALFFLSLSACSVAHNPVIQTFRQAVGQDEDALRARLDARFRYLRFVFNGHAVFIALGYVDGDPRNPVEVWYGAAREALRLQNGRVAGAVGLPVEWRSVSIPRMPSWPELARSATPFKWTRMRDVMPGYRFGVRDSLVLRRVSPPRGSELQNIDPGALTWFEENAEGSALPPARYAVDLRDGREEVVYGEQCLSADVCFTWQRWPVAPKGAR